MEKGIEKRKKAHSNKKDIEVKEKGHKTMKKRHRREGRDIGN